MRALKEKCYEIGWPNKDEILWIFSAFHEKRGRSSYWLFFTVLEGSMLATGEKKNNHRSYQAMNAVSSSHDRPGKTSPLTQQWHKHNGNNQPLF